MHNQIDHAIKVLREGGIIAYPTEGVWGLGCDPFNETAVLRLLKIKKRKIEKGLILIAADWGQVKALVKVNLSKCAIIKKNCQDPITWIFPATKKVPFWVCGGLDSVAVRVIVHPLARRLCQKFGGPIVSTSANLAGKSPAKNLRQLRKQFAWKVDCVVSGQVGTLKKPTQIRDVGTNELIRR